MIGRTLSHYKIVDELGRGGMGEVYRAEDTKLKRDVAIKVLPEEFAQDKERLARFEREAQLLASLNHPNIASIYGIEDADGVKALILELVEGPTLAERIAEGAIPVAEAIAIAKPNAHTSARLSTRLPFACSGLIYAAVPRITPTRVASLVSVGDIELSASGPSSTKALARPKSRTLMSPSSVSLMLAGLRSRWTIPCA